MGAYDKLVRDVEDFVDYAGKIISAESDHRIDLKRFKYLQLLLGDVETSAMGCYSGPHRLDIKNTVALLARFVDEIEFFLSRGNRLSEIDFFFDFYPKFEGVLLLGEFVKQLSENGEAYPIVVLEHKQIMNLSLLIDYVDILTEPGKPRTGQAHLPCGKRGYLVLPGLTGNKTGIQIESLGDKPSKTDVIVIENLTPGMNCYAIEMTDDFSSICVKKMFESQFLNEMTKLMGGEVGVLSR